MEKASIKEISPRAIEKAFASALQELTGKEWSITVNDLNYKVFGDELSLSPSTERFTMVVEASEVSPPCEKASFTPLF
ncbi:hypothetical protein [Chromobacterium haemolyticum]|uniref:hypothetical protein n=1 Tax=Chromobacterium haemolyticum TaxID=394935 RepID=UPI001130E085|nr:hypothetical protein [Chromobacterium haemolyticum]